MLSNVSGGDDGKILPNQISHEIDYEATLRFHKSQHDLQFESVEIESIHFSIENHILELDASIT